MLSLPRPHLQSLMVLVMVTLAIEKAVVVDLDVVEFITVAKTSCSMYHPLLRTLLMLVSLLMIIMPMSNFILTISL